MYMYDQKFSIQSIQQQQKIQNWMKKKFYIHVQIPPSVSTIKHSGRPESFVGLHNDKCPTKLSNKCPTKSSQVGVRVSTLR